MEIFAVTVKMLHHAHQAVVGIAAGKITHVAEVAAIVIRATGATAQARHTAEIRLEQMCVGILAVMKVIPTKAIGQLIAQLLMGRVAIAVMLLIKVTRVEVHEMLIVIAHVTKIRPAQTTPFTVAKATPTFAVAHAPTTPTCETTVSPLRQQT